jgi:hypothetical protein
MENSLESCGRQHVIVLAHDRRRVVHFEVTKNPMQVWLARQIQSAFPWDAAPRYLRDRDASYGQAFGDHVEAMGAALMGVRRPFC